MVNDVAVATMEPPIHAARSGSSNTSSRCGETTYREKRQLIARSVDEERPSEWPCTTHDPIETVCVPF